MRSWLVLLTLASGCAATPCPAPATPIETAEGVSADAHADIDALLDAVHLAAAEGREDDYFALYTPDAVFLGTDATERWSRDEFRAWAHPHFEDGHGWTLQKVRRTIILDDDGTHAWFDEDLFSDGLGPLRGSGVVVRTPDGWRLAHYNLALTIPNDAIDAVRAAIESVERPDAHGDETEGSDSSTDAESPSATSGE